MEGNALLFNKDIKESSVSCDNLVVYVDCQDLVAASAYQIARIL